MELLLDIGAPEALIVNLSFQIYFRVFLYIAFSVNQCGSGLSYLASALPLWRQIHDHRLLTILNELRFIQGYLRGLMLNQSRKALGFGLQVS